MRFRRRIPVLLGLLIFLAALFAVVELRKHAPPEPARLLPGADGYIYVNLKWMRRADIAKHLPEVPHDPEYEQFIQETGFQFERDLDQAAFAIHYASPATHGETRFSEVFVGHVDGSRLSAYLKKLASSVETYRGIDVYSISLENRTLRIAMLGVDTVAASNYDDVAVIHGIIDRSRKLASPFAGPAHLRQFYKYVPQLPLPSLGWVIFRVNPALVGSQVGSAPLAATPSGSASPGSKPMTVVASVRYLGAIHFRAEAFTASDQMAKDLTEQAGSFLDVFRSAEVSAGGQAPDADFKRAMDSIKIEQKNDRAVLTAIVPAELIRKIVAEAPGQLSPK